MSEKVSFGTREIAFWWVRGTVKGKERYQRVSVSSYNDANGNAHVSSSTTEFHEIWLVDPNGTEWCYKTSGFSLPYHEGHVFDFLYAQSGKNTKVLKISNRSTGYFLRYEDADRDLLHRHGWGTARVLTTMVLGFGVIPPMIKKHAVQMRADAVKTFDPELAQGRASYNAEWTAAGRDVHLKNQADARWERRSHDIYTRMGVATTPADLLYKFINNGEHAYAVWGLVLAVALHAWYRHKRPKFLSSLRKHIADMISRRDAGIS